MVHVCLLNVSDQSCRPMIVSGQTIIGCYVCKFDKDLKCSDADVYAGLQSSVIAPQELLRTTNKALQDLPPPLIENCKRSFCCVNGFTQRCWLHQIFADFKASILNVKDPTVLRHESSASCTHHSRCVRVGDIGKSAYVTS